MTKKILVSILLLSGVALAQPLPKSGEVYESLSYDLNKDGKAETIRLQAYNINAEVEMFWGRLQVTDPSGKVIWEAPKATITEQPFAFGMWPYGVSGLEWLGDIDADGKTELLSPAPVSDVRPPTYRRYRWTGKAFESLGRKMLLESPAGSGKFLWRDPKEWDGSTPLVWVSSFSGAPKIVAEIVSSRPDGTLLGGQAEMSGNGLGLTVTRWVRKLQTSE